MHMKIRSAFLPIAIFTVFLLAMAYIQFSTPDLADNDGFYHIKMAWLMRTEGLKPTFPWLPLTILNPREFYDHHFLFHIVLFPFTFGDLVSGAKWAAVFFSSLAFLSIWYLLKQQKITYAWLWSLGLLGISEAFLYRMSIPRAQSLSLAVLALGMTWILQGKYYRLASLGFLYVWLYDAFPLLLALAILYVIAKALSEKQLDLRPVIFIGFGLLLGMLVNPYFPFNLIFGYQHLVPKLFEATAINVGNEWYPYSTGQILGNSLPALIFFVGGVFALGSSGRKMDVRTSFSLLTCLLFGLMLFVARRFVEYFPPFTLIFTAFAWQPMLQSVITPSENSQVPEGDELSSWAKPFKQLKMTLNQPLPSLPPTILRWIPILLLSFVVLTITIFSINKAKLSVQNSKPFLLYSGAAAWLENNTPAGTRVFQTDWDDFPRLFFFNTHNTYLVGLDPTYLQLSNPDLYTFWVKVTQGEVEDLSVILPKRFGTNYVHSDLDHTDFINVAERDPGLKEVYRDQDAVLFEVINK